MSHLGGKKKNMGNMMQMLLHWMVWWVKNDVNHMLWPSKSPALNAVESRFDMLDVLLSEWQQKCKKLLDRLCKTQTQGREWCSLTNLPMFCRWRRPWVRWTFSWSWIFISPTMSSSRFFNSFVCVCVCVCVCECVCVWESERMLDFPLVQFLCKSENAN